MRVHLRTGIKWYLCGRRKTRTQLTLTQALQSWAVLIQSSWQKAPHFLQTSIAFSRHEQFFNNIDLLKFLAETTVEVEPLFEALPVTAPRRVKFSLLAAACWRIVARDGGLGFISEAGERSSTPSLESIDALEIDVAGDSLDKELLEPASLQGVLIVRFLAYAVLAVSIFGGALVVTAFKASVATATVTILKMGIDRWRGGRAFARSCFAASDRLDSVTRLGRQCDGSFWTGTVSGCIIALVILSDLAAEYCDLPKLGSLWPAVIVLLGEEAGAGASGAVK